jgi:hypothetical protein
MAAVRYEVVVQGRLGGSLVRWFDDLDVRPSGPERTCLSGWFPDQPALQGLLTHLGDLGLELVSVRRVGDDD